MVRCSRIAACALANLLLADLLPAAHAVAAPRLEVLYSFGGPDQTGANPKGDIAVDAAGSIYGTTAATNVDDGTAYRLTPPVGSETRWTYTLLWRFATGAVGVDPRGGLSAAEAGTFYGTTIFNNSLQAAGCGSVFALRQLGASWTTSPISRFGISPLQRGCSSYAPVTIGPDGALYGTTEDGGRFTFGAIFRLEPPARGRPGWTEHALYAFQGLADGYYPDGPLLLDQSGALYGTATASANAGPSKTPLYRLSPPPAGQDTWRFELIRRFESADCATVQGPLVADAAGAIYGTCSDNVVGGIDRPGSVFRLNPPATGQTEWTETILWRFTGGQDGGHPNTGVLFDAEGDLYGTTLQGNGTIFKLIRPAEGETAWRELTLWTFSAADGSTPGSPLAFDRRGALVGTTKYGGVNNLGTIFRLVP